MPLETGYGSNQSIHRVHASSQPAGQLARPPSKEQGTQGASKQASTQGAGGRASERGGGRWGGRASGLSLPCIDFPQASNKRWRPKPGIDGCMVPGVEALGARQASKHWEHKTLRVLRRLSCCAALRPSWMTSPSQPPNPIPTAHQPHHQPKPLADKAHNPLPLLDKMYWETGVTRGRLL